MKKHLRVCIGLFATIVLFTSTSLHAQSLSGTNATLTINDSALLYYFSSTPGPGSLSITDIINTQIRLTGATSLKIPDVIEQSPAITSAVISIASIGTANGDGPISLDGSGTAIFGGGGDFDGGTLAPGPKASIPARRMSYQLENQSLVLRSNEPLYLSTSSNNLIVLSPATTTYLWEISKDSGANWQQVGATSGDDLLYSSGTENPLVIGMLTMGMHTWQYRVTSTMSLSSGSTAVSTSNTIALNIKPSLIKSPAALAIDAADNLYVADPLTNAIWKISTDRKAGVFAGSPSGASGITDATGTNARFNHPQGIAIRGGKIYVADTGNNAIRVITSEGAVTTLAGASGQSGSYQEGAGGAARFDKPTALTVDAKGNIYVADSANNIIRKITPAGVTSRIAGERFAWGNSLTTVATLFDENGWLVGTTTLTVTTQRATGGAPQYIFGEQIIGTVTLANGATIMPNCTLAQSATLTIRERGQLSGEIITTTGSMLNLMGNIYHNARTMPRDSRFSWQTSPQSLPYYFNNASGITLSPDGKNLYVADSSNDNLCAVNLATGNITVIDQDIDGFASDVFAIYLPGLSNPRGIHFDKNNALLIADTHSSRILKYTGNGAAINAIAGLTNWYIIPGAASTRLYTDSFVDGAASEALFDNPSDIAIDNVGNIYVADTENAAIRKITFGGQSASVDTILLTAGPVQYAAITDTPVPASGGNDNSGGGGGGGGAPSAWYLLALGALAALRLRRR